MFRIIHRVAHNAASCILLYAIPYAHFVTNVANLHNLQKSLTRTLETLKSKLVQLKYNFLSMYLYK